MYNRYISRSNGLLYHIQKKGIIIYYKTSHNITCISIFKDNVEIGEERAVSIVLYWNVILSVLLLPLFNDRSLTDIIIFLSYKTPKFVNSISTLQNKSTFEKQSLEITSSKKSWNFSFLICFFQKEIINFPSDFITFSVNNPDSGLWLHNYCYCHGKLIIILNIKMSW